MNEQIFTTAKVTLWDRIKSAIWVIGFKVRAARRRKVSRARCEEFVRAQTVL